MGFLGLVTGDAYARDSLPPASPPVVEAEDVITSYESPKNGAGPLWCYGAPLLVRDGSSVFASIAETGKDVPPLSNTRCQIWRSDGKSWSVYWQEDGFHEREPCPVARLGKGQISVSTNPSTKPPGTKYGNCQPLVVDVSTSALGLPTTRPSEPAFVPGAQYTDHSYRGFAADAKRGDLLLMHEDSRTGIQYVSLRQGHGDWKALGKIEFPIRACYPQVSLRGGAAHVLAIGDIVEPVEEWRKLKYEKLKNDWDYVFRRLFYTWTDDVASRPFERPLEIDTVEKTGGGISNLDLYVDARGDAHVLYIRRPFSYGFLRDKYFPGQPMSATLEYAVIRKGKVVARQTWAESIEGQGDLVPAYGRFHEAADGTLLVVLAATVEGAGGAESANLVGAVRSEGRPDFVRIPLTHVFTMFFTNTVRGGSVPSNTLDLFGVGNDAPKLRYARVRLR